MKKLTAAVAMAVLCVAPAQADVIDYAELFGGVTFEPDQEVNGVDFEMDTGFNVGGAFGWILSPEFAVEADFFFTSADYDLAAPAEGTLESFTFMANAIYSFDTGSDFRPYVGAGLGGAQLRFTDGVSSGGVPYTGDSDIVFAYQAIAGVAINVDTNIDFIAEYRYQGASDASGTVSVGGVTGPLSFEYSSHNISAGFRFNL